MEISSRILLRLFSFSLCLISINTFSTQTPFKIKNYTYNEDSSTLSDKEKYLRTIDYIDHMANDIYCYWDLKQEQNNVNWPDLISDAKSKITDETNFTEFQQTLTELAASLHDGHVNYIYKPETRLFYTPISIKKIKSEYFISAVEHNKIQPYGADINPGDKILAVNNTPVADYIQNLSKYMSGSTEGMIISRTASSINSLTKFHTAANPGDYSIKFKIEKFDSHEVKTVELPWLIYNRSNVSSKPKQSLQDIAYSKILPGNIGVLTLTQMYHEEGIDAHINHIKQELKALSNTRALIVDVRDNGGGYGEIGDSVIAHLIDSKVKRYKAQLKNSLQVLYARPNLVELFTNINPSTDKYSEWVDFNIEPLAETKLYDKPVYVLTNERCFSACDTFVDSFSSNKIGEVLGEQTGGGTGYPLWFELPWKYGDFRFSVLRGYSNHNRYLEGIGTIPDVEIHTTARDLYNNIDGELVKSYQYILSKLDNKNMVKSLLNHQNIELYFANTKSEIVPFDIEEEYWQKIQSL